MPIDIAIMAKKPTGSAPPPMPKSFGRSAAPAAIAVSAKPSSAVMGGQDDETAEAQGSFTISPEAVSYRGPEKKCAACEYRADDQTCKILKISVEDEASCNAFESKSEDMGGMMPDAGAIEKGY